MEDNSGSIEPDVKGISDGAKQEALPADSPLRPLVTQWLEKINSARKAKSAFDSDAKEGVYFFDGPGSWFFEGGARGLSLSARPTPAPAFRVTINKAFEAVKLLGAVIYNRNPNRTVTPRKYPPVEPEMLGINPQSFQVDPMTGQPIPDPAVQMFVQTSQAIGLQDQKKAMQAKLLETYLNWTPVENDLKSHAKKAVNEGLIKGAGVLWTEAIEQPNVPPAPSTLIVGSFYDTVDNLFLDPDATDMSEVTWVAKRCVLPIDQVARMYGLSRADLKPNLESYDSAGHQTSAGEDTYMRRKRRTGKTNDLVTLYKVWSKTGMGDRLKGAKKSDRGIFDPLGDYCYIVVCDGVDFPLNIPPSVLSSAPDAEGLPGDLRIRASWPIPFWADNAWPCSIFAPHPKPNALWPVSHLKPGIGELRCMNWILSFLVQRIAVSCETMVGVSKAADHDLKQQLLAPSEGGFKIVEISEALGKSVNDIVSVFQMPNATDEIWRVFAALSEQFDKRVGLTELVYGQTRASMRSASEAQVKQDNLSIRPDELANTAEDWMTEVSRKEAMAARWLLRPEDVAPVLGPLGAEAWRMHLASGGGDQMGGIAREFEYRVESGSARKPNKAMRAESMQQALQTIGPVVQQLIGAGNPAPWNALISSWADANDIDASAFMIPPPPPPAPAAPPSADPAVEGGGAPPTPQLGNG